MAALLSLALPPSLACAGENCHRRDTDRLEVLPGCRQTVPGTLAISAGALARLRFNANGLAALQAGSTTTSAAMAPTCRSSPMTTVRTTSPKA